jgi:hypothetical protein
LEAVLILKFKAFVFVIFGIILEDLEHSFALGTCFIERVKCKEVDEVIRLLLSRLPEKTVFD